MTKLISKKFNNQKFSHPLGYVVPTGYGVLDEKTGLWLSFDGKNPFNPIGGRKSTVEVANTVIIDENTKWVQEL